MPPSAAAPSKAVEPPPLSQLRKVFNTFDENGSGTVDTDEMTKMVRKLNLNMSAADISALMKEADPDGSGEIDFYEFSAALRKQLKEGKGGLGAVVSEGGGAFGWLNPLSWFGGEEAAAPASPASKQGRGTGARRPASAGARSSGKSKSKLSSTSSRSERSPTHRMKKTQAAVVEDNLLQAAAMRTEAAAAKDWFREQQDEFLKGQHEKVLKGHQQAVERAVALEALKRNKRSVGVEMREQFERKWKDELQRKREFVEKSHSVVFDARKKKQVAVKARKQYEQEQALAIGEAAKIARAERREQTKATVRKQEKEARDYTSRVRYETRPAVRQESSDLFQRQRNEIAEELRQRHEMERQEVQQTREAYLQKANQVRTRPPATCAAACGRARGHGPAVNLRARPPRTHALTWRPAP